MLAAVFSLAFLSGRPAPVAWAQQAVPPLSGRVVDRAEILSAQTESTLTTMLAAHEDSTGNQVAVLTVPSLEGEPIESFALRVAEAWQLGTAQHDNGVLLVVARDDRELRIEVGYGLEGPLPDAVARRIIDNEIVPYFRQGDYEAGVLAGVLTIIDRLSHPDAEPAYAAGIGASSHAEALSPGETDWEVFWVMLVFFVLMPLIGSAYGLVAKTFEARAVTYVFMLLALLAGGTVITGELVPAWNYEIEIFGGGLLLAALYSIVYWWGNHRLSKAPELRKQWAERLDRLADGKILFAGGAVGRESRARRRRRRLSVLAFYVVLGGLLAWLWHPGYAFLFYHNLFWLFVTYRGTLHPSPSSGTSHGSSSWSSSRSSSNWSSSRSSSGWLSRSSSSSFSGGGGSFGGGGASGSW